MESKCIKYSNRKMWKNSNGKLHRENDLPAVEFNDNGKVWFINGKRHREIGPAVIRPNGGLEEWYLNDNQYLPKNMPSFLYVNYLRWEYKKKNGI